MDRDQVLREPPDVREHGVAGKRDIQDRAGEGCRGRDKLAFDGEDLVDPPPSHIGKGEQSQRLACWRAVDDDRLPFSGLKMGLESQQREHLVHAGRDGQFRG